jgi:hypothetical protein
MIDLNALMRDPEWLRYIVWVKRLGYGFHADTAGADYTPALSPEEVRDYDIAVAAAFGRTDADPYEVAIAVWEENGLPGVFHLRP